MLHALWLIAATGAATADPSSMEASRMDASWRHGLQWRGQAASIQAGKDGHVLRMPQGERVIAPQPLSSETASPLFDGLFALAQAELEEAKVSAITDWGFNHQRPLPCECFETGEKWRYVWTRDLSFAADLALARLEPERTRTSLRFKLSEVRKADAPQGLYVAQDTGSGGSWPVSTDRVVWFLAARHLLDDAAFADQTWHALTATLAQDREYAFDADIGLYRGETSFLDWREQSYPAWTAKEVGFIAESFALSTNVLHHEALRLAARMARRRNDARADDYARQADALKQAIDARFWREDRGLYMSYIGTAAHPVPFEAHDLLGLSLAITSGIAPPERARRALANYPTLPSGSPVIWPQQPGVPIYHNRAIWPFVSAYALRAARTVEDPARIAHELRSLMRGAALGGSNMENHELVTQAVHVEDGRLSGPVVNSKRQLWSVAGYLDMVLQGVFGLQPDGAVKPKLPVELVPMLFGDRDRIVLRLRDRRIVLRLPDTVHGNLLVAGRTRRRGAETVVELVDRQMASSPLTGGADAFAPRSPPAPVVRREGARWRIGLPRGTRLYVDGARVADVSGRRSIALDALPVRQCASLTRVGTGGIESLHGPTACFGAADSVAGAWPRHWTAPRDGRYEARLDYRNANGPINTGITAAVKRLAIACDGAPAQSGVLVMPHAETALASTPATFGARAGAQCRFDLVDGFNMSYLAHFRHYTGGKGGEAGPLNTADTGTLRIAPVAVPPGTHPEDTTR